MRLATIFLTVLATTSALPGPAASGAPTEEVVLIGRSDLLAQNAPSPRRISRIERFVAPSPTAIADPVLATLDDQAPLLESMRPRQPVLDQFVAAPVQVDTHAALAGNLPVATTVPVSVEGPQSNWLWPENPPQEGVTATTICLVLFLMAAVALRRTIFGAINQLVLRLVVAVRHPGVRVSSTPLRGKRRRRSSRRRAPDVSWYFRGARESGKSRTSRRRWSRASRPREYVVTDVVYAAAPQQPSQYLLLSNSVN